MERTEDSAQGLTLDANNDVKTALLLGLSYGFVYPAGVDIGVMAKVARVASAQPTDAFPYLGTLAVAAE